jgi:hypothetical protein
MRALALFALLLAGCMFITQFNPEGQPCDTAASPEQQCLAHFHCENDRCVSGDFDFDAGAKDGG